MKRYKEIRGGRESHESQLPWLILQNLWNPKSSIMPYVKVNLGHSKPLCKKELFLTQLVKFLTCYTLVSYIIWSNESEFGANL